MRRAGPKGRDDEIRALAPDRLQELLRQRRVPDRARPDRRRRAERLRQVEPRRSPALGDGRELVQEHARLRHGGRHLLRLRQAPLAQQRRGRARAHNSDRRAPAAFNDSETIEVTRRIERDNGSTYRVNGKEVRARDVQLLFADASTGARSPSLVRQGQIGEIISAKPQARRLILEEAAGVSGLHSRRHEAELRLKGAEDNLIRVEDVLKQIDAQVDSLKRQARQSNRYRELAGAIRRQEALARLIAWREHEAAFAEARRRLDADLLEVAERTRAQAEAARLQAIAAAALPALARGGGAARRGLHRIALARDALEAEEKRAKEREAELERRIAQFAGDLQREEALIADAAGVMDRLAAEDAALAQQGAQADEDAAQAREAEESAQRRLASAESDARRGAGRGVGPRRPSPGAA